MVDEKILRFVFFQECGHRLDEISLFSYEKFLEEGRGFIIVEPDDSKEDNFSYRYSTEAQTENYYVDLDGYDPKREMVIFMVRPDNNYAFTHTFLDPLTRPAYLHMMKNMFGPK